MDLILVCHGATDSAPGVCIGQADLALSSDGFTGVQRLARKVAQGVDQQVGRAFGDTRSPAVQGIADERIVPMRHMHANLVRAAGLQVDRDAGMVPEALRQAVVRNRGLATHGDDRHFLALPGMATNRCINGAATCHRAYTHSAIFPFDGAFLQLLNQVVVRRQRSCHHQQP